MFADCLDLHDINTLVRTTRALNRLLTPYMYRFAKDLRSRSGYGTPYFLRAVEAGNLTAVKHFIEVGTSVNMSDPTDLYHPTALHSCVEGGYIKLAQLLIQHGVNMSPVNRLGETPLHRALGWKSEETWVRLLVDAGADICARTVNGETILSWAMTSGKLSTVQLLLERGAIPTTRNRRGSTLLHISLHCAAASQSAAKLGLLLEAGLNIEATNNLGETPLHYAAKFGKDDCVFQLLQRGANVDAINFAGRTPLQAFLTSPECYHQGKNAARHILHHATLPEECASKGNQACVPGCRFLESDEPVVDLLLSAGADIRASRGSTRSPLDWAASLLNI
jgi:ankyrin repeat protein